MLDAELWGVVDCMEMAWNYGARRVIMEGDSNMVVKILNGANQSFMDKSNLIHKCRGLMSRNWEVKVVHAFREQNVVADGLAKYARLCNRGLAILDTSPSVMEQCIWSDSVGRITRSVIHENEDQ